MRTGDSRFHFEWDEKKAAANLPKHDISFELASTAFYDPALLTVADLAHSEGEERWLSVGCAATGVVLAVAYLWVEISQAVIKIRLISARRATAAEVRQYQQGL